MSNSNNFHRGPKGHFAKFGKRSQGTGFRRGKGKGKGARSGNEVNPNEMVWITPRGGTMFPPRARIVGRVAFNANITFTAGAVQYQFLDLNNPITVSSGQVCSGLAWLISGAQNNGTSYAPYNLGIVRSAKIELYGKTAASPNGNTGALTTMFPLPPAVSTTSLSLTQAEEQFGRSNIVEYPLGIDTVTRSKPLIVKKYKLWDLFGVSEEVYMNDFQSYAFGYSGLLTTATLIGAVVVTGTESATTDTTLAIRTNIIIDLEIELFSRNSLIATTPHV
jgi:hypothetical protein